MPHTSPAASDAASRQAVSRTIESVEQVAIELAALSELQGEIGRKREIYGRPLYDDYDVDPCSADYDVDPVALAALPLDVAVPGYDSWRHILRRSRDAISLFWIALEGATNAIARVPRPFPPVDDRMPAERWAAVAAGVLADLRAKLSYTLPNKEPDLRAFVHHQFPDLWLKFVGPLDNLARELRVALLATEATKSDKPAEPAASELMETIAPAGKDKRSTARGDGAAKLVSGLTKHHMYADGSCLNLEPIGNNELARLAGVDKATASAFFKKDFKGHRKYKAACADKTLLLAALKLLNEEFSPHDLYGRRPPGEREPDDD